MRRSALPSSLDALPFSALSPPPLLIYIVGVDLPRSLNLMLLSRQLIFDDTLHAGVIQDMVMATLCVFEFRFLLLFPRQKKPGMRPSPAAARCHPRR